MAIDQTKGERGNDMCGQQKVTQTLRGKLKGGLKIIAGMCRVFMPSNCYGSNKRGRRF